MSTYPGEPPEQPSEDQQVPAPQDVEHTAPITPTAPGPVFNPTTAQPVTEPSAPQQPYPLPGYQQPYSQQPQAQQPYPQGYQQPYAQPPYGQQPYAPGGYGQQPQHPYGAYAPPPPKHPQSTTAMVLGIVGLVGALFSCGLTLFLAPFAWALGRNALKETQAAQGRLGGESQARAGMVTGIIGTVLLVIAILLVVLLVILGLASSSGGDFGSGTNA
jgi:hypothetical protein